MTQSLPAALCEPGAGERSGTCERFSNTGNCGVHPAGRPTPGRWSREAVRDAILAFAALGGTLRATVGALRWWFPMVAGGGFVVAAAG